MNTHDQQRKDNKHKGITNAWLKQGGINPAKLELSPLHIQQATMIATNLLKHNAKLLGQNEVHTLNNFLVATKSNAKRRKLTLANAHKVMNIGSAVNRLLFKEIRQTK